MNTITKILVIGGGRIGRELARQLPGVTLIEADPAQVIMLRKELDNVAVVHGDARSRDTLVHAGIQDVDEVFIATNRDNINFECAMIAKEFNVPKIIARVNETVNMASFFDKAIEVVPWRATMGTDMVDTFLHPDSRHVAEVVICGRSQALGRKLEDLKLPDGSIIAAVLHGDHLYAPANDLEIQKGDVLSIHSTKRDVHDIIQMITGGKKGLAPFDHILVPLFKTADIHAFREAAMIAKAADARLITGDQPRRVDISPVALPAEYCDRIAPPRTVTDLGDQEPQAVPAHFSHGRWPSALGHDRIVRAQNCTIIRCRYRGANDLYRKSRRCQMAGDVLETRREDP